MGRLTTVSTRTIAREELALIHQAKGILTSNSRSVTVEARRTVSPRACHISGVRRSAIGTLSLSWSVTENHIGQRWHVPLHSAVTGGSQCRCHFAFHAR